MSIITPASVREWADLDSTVTDEFLQPVIDAIEAAVSKFYDVPETVDDVEHADLILGLRMHVTRLFMRSKTPEGLIKFGPEFGIRVNKFDPDIDFLLAGYRKWVFA